MLGTQQVKLSLLTRCGYTGSYTLHVLTCFHLLGHILEMGPFYHHSGRNWLQVTENKQKDMHKPSKYKNFILSHVSSRGYKIGPICLSVCLSVSALPAEPFDVRN